MTAALWELHDAWLGHAEYHGLLPRAPAITRAFMQAMMEKFPDGEKHHERD